VTLAKGHSIRFQEIGLMRLSSIAGPVSLDAFARPSFAHLSIPLSIDEVHRA